MSGSRLPLLYCFAKTEKCVKSRIINLEHSEIARAARCRRETRERETRERERERERDPAPVKEGGIFIGAGVHPVRATRRRDSAERVFVKRRGTYPCKLYQKLYPNRSIRSAVYGTPLRMRQIKFPPVLHNSLVCSKRHQQICYCSAMRESISRDLYPLEYLIRIATISMRRDWSTPLKAQRLYLAAGKILSRFSDVEEREFKPF